MLTEKSTQTDGQGIGLSPEEEAIRTQKIHKEQDLLLEEYEEQYRTLLEKTEYLESSIHATSRIIAQLKSENGVLDDERTRNEATILELEQTISQRLTKVSTLKDEVALRDIAIEEQADLLTTIESQKRQIEELIRVNAQTVDSLSTEIDRLTICLARSSLDSQRLTTLNHDLQQQTRDLKDQLVKDNSVAQSPFTPWMGGPTLAADFWPPSKEQPFAPDLMSTNPLFTECSGLQSEMATGHVFHEVELGTSCLLTNALFIERQKNKLLVDALQQYPREGVRSLNGSWINKVNRDHILTLLDGLMGYQEDLHALPVASFMKVLHDVEATIQYGRAHQESYAGFAAPCDRHFFFSHNKEGVKNSVKVTDRWERHLRSRLNIIVANCLIHSNVTQGDLAKITSGDITQFRDECTRAFIESVQNCFLNERFSGYKSHSFRAYLHNLGALGGLSDSGASLIAPVAIHDKVTSSHYTKTLMEQTERGLRNQLPLVSFSHTMGYDTL